MLNVAIIGLGNISLLYDTSKNNKQALSHIKAIFLHKQFYLKYIIDIEDKNVSIAKKFFPNTIFSTDYKTLLEKNDIDILVVSTPTNTHFNIVNEFSNNLDIKLFFIEKPLFNTLKEYNNINNNIKDKIVVNYLRRFDKSIQELKNKITNKILKNPQKIIIHYCKGFKNNGSHMIDLVNFLFSNPTILSSKILNISQGFSTEDKNFDIYLTIKYKNNIIPLYFISHNHNNYNLISLEIFFENMKVIYENSKATIEYKKIINDKNYPTYRVFEDIPKITNVDSLYMMYNAYDNIYKQIIHNIPNISSYNDELKNIKFLEIMKVK